MKTLILPLLAVLSLSSCIKDLQVTPDTKKTPATSTVTAVASNDTIPDKAVFRLRLTKDNVNYDETMFMFDKKACLTYDDSQDGRYFPGFGQVSLASISKDGTDLAIYRLPYTPNMGVGLDVNAKADGAYSLSINYEKQLPADVSLWLKDRYLKDSVDVRGVTYNFNIAKTDTASFGKNRFELVIRKKVAKNTSVGPN